MNILIPHSWLKEFVKTDATPETIAEKLSLCSLSVEKLHPKGSDVVYEIEITPNRYDTLSVLGVAREVAAVLPRFGIKAELTTLDTLETLDALDTDLLNATVTDPTLCPRFTAIVLDRIELKPSPKLVRDRLEMSGIRALNNVIDISNYLMLELGQPMHIFDFDKLGNNDVKEMILRESKKGERLVTLDGVERELSKGAIVIESGGKLVDLCGIMGGENSAVDENTRRILLFIQIYDPSKIRKTSQQLALRTEASTRFEKGIDPQGIIPAMSTAIKMLRENANARVASKIVDVQNEVYAPHQIELEIPKVEKLIGVRIERNEIIEIIKSLGFEVKVLNSGFEAPSLQVTVPSWRNKDILIPEDLIEEIARVYGYHNLPNIMPTGEIPSVLREKKFHLEDKSKDFLKHQGFFEVYNYSFISNEQIIDTKLDPLKSIRLKNPLNVDLLYLRPSLLPSLLQNLSENQHHTDEIKLFELERIYIPTKNQDLPRENFRLTGVSYSHLQSPTSHFFTVKGIVEGLLSELGIKEIDFTPLKSQNALISLEKKVIGQIGGVDEENLIVAFDLDFEQISSIATDRKSFTPIPEYPPIIEDLSLILPPKTFIAEVILLIKKQSRLVKKIEVVDIYPEKGSVTLRITYQSEKKTLTEKEIERIRQKILRTLKASLGAEIRS